MLDTLTVDTFTPMIGQAFYASAGNARLELTLTAVDPLGGASGPSRRRSFSLTFHSAAREVLPQSIYRLESGGLPPLELFLVPLGPDADGIRYEAIFT